MGHPYKKKRFITRNTTDCHLYLFFFPNYCKEMNNLYADDEVVKSKIDI